MLDEMILAGKPFSGISRRRTFTFAENPTAVSSNARFEPSSRPVLALRHGSATLARKHCQNYWYFWYATVETAPGSTQNWRGYSLRHISVNECLTGPVVIVLNNTTHTTLELICLGLVDSVAIWLAHDETWIAKLDRSLCTPLYSKKWSDVTLGTGYNIDITLRRW